LGPWGTPDTSLTTSRPDKAGLLLLLLLLALVLDNCFPQLLLLLLLLLLSRLDVLLVLHVCAAARRTLAAASSMRSMAESGRRLSGIYLQAAGHMGYSCSQASLAVQVELALSKMI
jgi:hypothetical protein